MENRLHKRPSDCDFQHQWISEAAYYKAESRDFMPGMELEDWLFAEHEFVIMQIMRFQAISSEDGGMSIKGLQRLARSLGVENTNTQIVDLIHAIQKVTNNNSCFGFEPGKHCNITEYCLWKSECKKMIANWLPLNGLHK